MGYQVCAGDEALGECELDKLNGLRAVGGWVCGDCPAVWVWFLHVGMVVDGLVGGEFFSYGWGVHLIVGMERVNSS